MTLAQKIDHYAKAVVAAIGSALVIVTSIVGSVGFAIPADYLAYITSAITVATAVSVFITKNAPLVAEIANQVDGDPLT